MIKIRLQRGGKKNQPLYRIVVTEKSLKRSGKAIEVLGSWDPEKDKLTIDKKKVDEWIKKGAQPTNSVKKLL